MQYTSSLFCRHRLRHSRRLLTKYASSVYLQLISLFGHLSQSRSDTMTSLEHIAAGRWHSYARIQSTGTDLRADTTPHGACFSVARGGASVSAHYRAFSCSQCRSSRCAYSGDAGTIGHCVQRGALVVVPPECRGDLRPARECRQRKRGDAQNIKETEFVSQT